MPEEKVFDRIMEEVIALNEEGVVQETEGALKQGFLPKDIISKGLVKGMEIIGNKFENRELFLPELVLSAKVMESVYNLLKPYLAEQDFKNSGKVLLGTAYGDVHDIGKNIFGAVLQGDGFQVYDLGVDVMPDEFLKKAKELQPDVIGISALISTAVSGINETIMILKDNEIPAKIAVGGAALTLESAKKIGADVYGKDAWEGLKIIRKLIKEGSQI